MGKKAGKKERRNEKLTWSAVADFTSSSWSCPPSRRVVFVTSRPGVVPVLDASSSPRPRGLIVLVASAASHQPCHRGSSPPWSASTDPPDSSMVGGGRVGTQCARIDAVVPSSPSSLLLRCLVMRASSVSDEPLGLSGAGGGGGRQCVKRVIGLVDGMGGHGCDERRVERAWR